MYLYSPDGELSPGDIIKSVRLVERTADAESETLRTVPANVIVLSQGCEIDKVAKHGNRSASVGDRHNITGGDRGHDLRRVLLELTYAGGLHVLHSSTLRLPGCSQPLIGC